MDDPKELLAKRLRTRFAQYVASGSRYRAPLIASLNRIADLADDTFVFGGLLRDLATKAGPVMPRDIDVVVSSTDLTRIARAFGPAVRRKTRFGGLVLNVQGWRIDVWELGSTWAFREQLIAPASFADLPRTTFLNIEAIAIELRPRRGKPRRLFEHGFFDAIQRRVVEINLEQNPFNSLAVVRALLVASVTGFKLGPELRRFVLDHADQSSLESLISVQLEHYGVVRRLPSTLRMWLQYLEDADPSVGAELPTPGGVQLAFWQTLNWDVLIDPKSTPGKLRGAI